MFGRRRGKRFVESIEESLFRFGIRFRSRASRRRGVLGRR